MVPPDRIQVPGFEESDDHFTVISKAAKGLGLDAPSHYLSLVISNSLVRDRELPSWKPWTLGNYTEEFGGPQARAKRIFRIYVEEPDSSDEEVLCHTSHATINYKSSAPISTSQKFIS